MATSMCLFLIIALNGFGPKAEAKSDVILAVLSQVDLYTEYPYLIENKRSGIILFKNKAFHETLSNDSIPLYSVDEGFLYHYDIDYFLVVDSIQFSKGKCNVVLHSTSRFKNESNKEKRYFQLIALVVWKEMRWELESYSVLETDCCRWKVESWND